MKTIKRILITVGSLLLVTAMFVYFGNLINTYSPHTNGLFGIMFGLIYICWFIVIKDWVWDRF